MIIGISVGVAILLWLGYFIWLKLASKQVGQDIEQMQKVTPHLSFRDLLLDVSWPEIMDELKRISKHEQRDLQKTQHAYDELVQLQPLQAIRCNFILYLHMNESTKFFDVYAQEQGDPYTEYMIDYDNWRQVLLYLVDVDSLKTYGKLTIVAAVLYSITSVGYSLTEVMEKRQTLQSRQRVF